MKSPSRPSQLLAHNLRKRGIERTPQQARDMLMMAIGAARRHLDCSNTSLPPWPRNAFEVVRRMNAGVVVWVMEDELGRSYVSAYPNGKDWENSMGEL